MSVRARQIVDRDEWLSWRSKDVTASDAAALFGDGVHPYRSAYELWAVKSGRVVVDKRETPAMRRGRLLEPVALELLAEERRGWQIAPCGEYYDDPAEHIGATPDTKAWRPDREGFGTIQIKTAGQFAYRANWAEEIEAERAPLWVAVQASIEAALMGASWASVAVMTFGEGIDIRVVDIPLKPAIFSRFRELAADFWRRVREGDSYPPDWNRDAALVSRMLTDDEGGEIDLSADAEAAALVARRTILSETAAQGVEAERERKLIDARLVHKLGNASRGYLAGGAVLSAKTTRRKGFVVKPSVYRQVRIKHELPAADRPYAALEALARFPRHKETA